MNGPRNPGQTRYFVWLANKVPGACVCVKTSHGGARRHGRGAQVQPVPSGVGYAEGPPARISWRLQGRLGDLDSYPSGSVPRRVFTDVETDRAAAPAGRTSAPVGPPPWATGRRGARGGSAQPTGWAPSEPHPPPSEPHPPAPSGFVALPAGAGVDDDGGPAALLEAELSRGLERVQVA
jgi:hypothetical protein